MANVQNNRISASITAEQMQTVKTALKTIYQQLPFLIGLTVEERQALPKINIANKSFVEDCLAAMSNNPDMLPAYISTSEVDRDFSLFRQLDELVLIVGQLSEQLRDTQMLAGSEAYSQALISYRLFEAAARAGMPGADTVYDTLRERFEGHGSKTTQAQTPSDNGIVA